MPWPKLPPASLSRIGRRCGALAGVCALLGATWLWGQPGEPQPPAIGRGLQWLLQGGAQEQIPAPGLNRPRPPERTRGPRSPAADAASTDPRPSVSLNADVQVARAQQQLEGFITREKWPEVVAGLQQLVEGSATESDTFAYGAQGEWTSAQRWAQQRIETLPPPGLRLYQQVYSPVAADLLSAARNSGELGRLADVSRRFLHTPAGSAATADVAIAYFDRGDYLASVRWLERLPATPRGQLSVTTQVRYALALWAGGRRADAERVIARLAVQGASELPGGVADESLAAWWRAAPKPTLPAALAQSQWPVFLGNATHSGVARAGSPLLLEEWSLPMTYVPAVRTQLESLAADLRDAGRACIPAISLVLVGDRLAVRTLRGVEVVDLSTGKPLWAVPLEEASPDRLLSGSVSGTGEVRAQQLRLASQVQYADAGDYDQHPLTSWLYRDAVSGTLSSDGQRLFVLTQHAQLGRSNYGYWLGPQDEEADPFFRDWATNVIAAYDLATGAELWQVGGTRTGEAFERPLAGTYFFGTPVAAEDELYVVGERDNEVCLFVLDRTTGQPVWTQPLANSQAKVDVDATRRQWTCQPAVTEGVVVCPTTTGWTVAIDRLERRLLWAHSCEPAGGANQQQQSAGAVVQPLQPLNVRWESTPPIISGRYVLITPSELPDAFYAQEPVLICLDLETGQELWREPKSDDGLYVGGVLNDRVLLVGRGQVRALDLVTGEDRWSLTLPGDQPPAGRGIIAGDHYLLPLAGGGLWELRVADGKVLDRQQLPDAVAALGNLTMSRGRLVSVDPVSVRSFAEATTLEAEIARRQALDPQDLWAALRQSQVARLRGDFDAAIAVLQPLRARVESAAPGLRQEIQSLLRACLLEQVRGDLHGRDAEYQWLTELGPVTADAEVHQLAVERALVRRAAATAWSLLWPASTLTGQDPLLLSDGREVRASAWIAGRLQQLYELADLPLRSAMDETFATVAATPAEGVPERLEALVAFHAVGQRVSAELAEAAEERGDFAGAEIRWRRLSATDDPAVSLPAALRLAAWWQRHAQTRDAAVLLAEIEDRIAGLPEEMRPALATEWMRVCTALQLTPARTEVVSPDWTDAAFETRIERRQPQDQTPQEVYLAPGRATFYLTHRVEFLPQTQRLRIRGPDGTDWWSLPLRTPTRQLFDQTVGLRTDGLQAYAVWQGVVAALSLPDRRVRWSFPIDLRMSGANYVRNAQAEENHVLLPTEQFTQQWGLRRYRSPTGMVAAADAHSVLLHGRRGIVCLDALTGDVRWTRTGLPPQTMVYLDHPRVYGLPTDGSDPFLLNVVDGSELDNTPLQQYAGQSIGLRRGVLTTLTTTSRGFFGLISPQARLTGKDAVSGAELWSERLDARTRIGWLSDEQLALLAPDGRLEACDIVSGERVELGRLPPEIRVTSGPVELLTDARFAFLLFDRKWRQWSDHVTLPNVQINGDIVCFARDGSGLRWRRAITEQRLLLQPFATTPLLAFFNQASEDPLQQVRVELWDKATGQPVLPAADLRISPQTYQFECDAAKRVLRFVGNTLQVEVRPAAAIPSDLPAL